MLNVSGSEAAFLLVLAVAEGALGYYLSEVDRRDLGRTPWGIPSIVWAFIWFLSLLLGLILWIFAHRSEVRRAAQTPYGPMSGPPSPVMQQPVHASASDFPAYPRRADGGGREPSNPPPTPTTPAGQAPAGQASAGQAPAGQVSGTEASPPAWHPDPSGRFHYRWWTGTEWTSYVSTHGRVEIDTNPDQRIGPYT